MNVPNNQEIKSPSNIEILSHIDFTKYRICKTKQSPECINIGLKENFKGKQCKKCYNVERLYYSRKKYTDKKIEKLQSSGLLNIANPEQMAKIAGILEPTQFDTLNRIIAYYIYEKIDIDDLNINKIENNNDTKPNNIPENKPKINLI